MLAVAGMAFAAGSSPILPDPKLTPGDALTCDPKVICVSGYTKTVRNVPSSLKDEVYKSYGIVTRAKGEYEIDHLISLELGGSNSIRNLWPESYITEPLNAHVKDKLENALHDLACSGKLTFQQAQAAIAANWLTAYEKYLGPLPGGAKSSQFTVGSTLPSATGATPAGAATGAAAGGQASGGDCPADKPIKGSRSHIYHLQNDPNYKATKPVACFASEADAQAAGYRAPKR